MIHRAFRLVAVALLALSGLGLVSTGVVDARQSDDCAEIEAYIAALEATGNELEASMPADEDSNLDEWTAEEFTAASDALTAAQEAFDGIEPPPVAESFHAVLVEQFGVLAAMFDTMSTAGVFGALIYVEQLDALDAELTAEAEAIEGACGVELTDVVENEETAATPVAVIDGPTDESGIPANGDAPGTRADPIPLGQTAQIHPDWEMTVVSVTPDATELILNEHSFNEPPAPGHQFFMATVRLTYIGETSDEFYVSDLSAVGQSAVGYNQFDDYCGTIPNELPSRELFTGGTIEGNVCWSIASEDATSLVLYDNYGDDRVFLSMMPDTGLAATPVATEQGNSPAITTREMGVSESGFQPATVQVASSELPLEISVSNSGSSTHSFTVTALGIDASIAPGDTSLVTIPAGTTPGTYGITSVVDGQQEAGMIGLLVIE